MLMNDKKMNACKKCDKPIGGRAYYIMKLNCIFDGNQTSSCDTIVLCSECYHNLHKWLQIKNNENH